MTDLQLINALGRALAYLQDGVIIHIDNDLHVAKVWMWALMDTGCHEEIRVIREYEDKHNVLFPEGKGKRWEWQH